MMNDRMTDAMEALISAVSALGFERARDAISAYGDEPDEDAADWHAAFIDMVETAVGVAEDASGREGNTRWIAMGPDAGVCIRWAWRGNPDGEFAGVLLRSVVKMLGREDHTPSAHEALRLALPVMRRTAAEYLESVMVRHDPATITPAEWAEIAPDLDAILAAEACVGRIPDDADRDRLWLDPILDARGWRGRAEDVA